VKRLFIRSLLTLLAALLILIAVMVIVSLTGFRRSLDEWSRTRVLQLEEVARAILIQFPNPVSVVIPDDVPLFVYNSQKELIFSNRGEGGRRRSSGSGTSPGGQGDLIPVEVDGKLLGYFRSGMMRFENDAANSRFLNSLRLTVGLSFALALIIAIPFSLLFSRSLSRPAVLLAEGLDRITHGDLSVPIPERGAEEIARIARSTNRLNRQLRRERDIRRQWVQDIAHDLRTPIAAMRAQFEGMRDGVLDLSQDRIGRSLKEISRIETLVADLEELMHLESPEMTVSIKEVEAAVVIEEISERFSAELAKKRIQFVSRKSMDHFSADPRLLQRAVTNFFANAVRHTPTEGRIDLSIDAAPEGRIALTVVNSGQSIPDEELGKVFDRLYRGEYARYSPGSGLGLTIAKRIAELHGGSVSIRNREEGGVAVEMIL
jgi:two-component system sensor histidine kinase BaeS